MARDRFKKPVIERDEIIKDFSFEGAIAADNPVRVIDLVVEKIVDANPEAFLTKKDSVFGSTSYHPKVLLKLYLYGYYNRIQSSRRLEKESQRNIEVIWLLRGQMPDHWTINRYRLKHKDQIALLTKEFRGFLFKEGFIEIKTVTVDGTKVKANQRRDVLTIGKLDKKLLSLDRKMDEYLGMLNSRDEIEDLEEEVMKKEEEKENLQKKASILSEEVSSIERDIRRIIEKKRTFRQ